MIFIPGLFVFRKLQNDATKPGVREREREREKDEMACQYYVNHKHKTYVSISCSFQHKMGTS